MRTVAPLALLLLASACTKQPAPEPSANASNTAMATAPAPAPTPPPASAEVKAAAAAADRLPAAFAGRWGMGPKDCDPKFDYVAKGLMVVAPDKLTFYEMRAKVTKVSLESPTRAVADLDWSGEGMRWKTHTPLTLSADGKSLTRLDHETKLDVHYDRCPA